MIFSRANSLLRRLWGISAKLEQATKGDLLLNKPGRTSDTLNRREALTVTGAYMVVAFGWILLSGHACSYLAQEDSELLALLDRLKEVAFVLLTGFALFFSVTASTRRRQRMDAEKQQAEAMLAVSTKYESLGQFAATLAHDFNNILTAIGMASELVEASDAETRNLAINSIQNSVKQAQKSVANLMGFVRREPEQSINYDVGLTLKDNLCLVQQVLGTPYKIDLQLPAGPVVVKGAPDILLQAVINLAANARDAMEGRNNARVAVSLERRVLRRYRSVFNSSPVSGDFAMLSVADKGCGIAAEHLPQIFAPLFTTKPVGKGTGLGLSSALQAVRQHSGWMEVESTVGSGSTFSLYLPISCRLNRIR